MFDVMVTMSLITNPFSPMLHHVLTQHTHTHTHRHTHTHTHTHTPNIENLTESENILHLLQITMTISISIVTFEIGFLKLDKEKASLPTKLSS